MRRRQLAQHGGKPLLNLYPSVEAVLRKIYPDYSWDSTKFVPSRTKKASGYWKSLAHQKRFFDQIGRELGVLEVGLLRFASFLLSSICFLFLCIDTKQTNKAIRLVCHY